MLEYKFLDRAYLFRGCPSSWSCHEACDSVCGSVPGCDCASLKVECPFCKRIKETSTGNSLVMLDEVGAGADLTEGAALGMALLELFAHSGRGGSFLIMATTHHGEVKTLKYGDSRFENASVQFSEEKLRPTYKLLWGVPEFSKALRFLIMPIADPLLSFLRISSDSVNLRARNFSTLRDTRPGNLGFK